MSAKWSVFPVAPNVLNADILATVQAGLNYQTTRPVMLSAVPGEAIQLVNGLNILGIDAGGNCGCVCNTPLLLYLQYDSTLVFDVQNPGGVTLNALPGLPLSINCNGTNIFIDSAGALTITMVAGQDLEILGSNAAALTMSAAGGTTLEDGLSGTCQVSYVPSVPGNWAGNPVGLADAVNRLAEAVAGLLGTPIP
jgi:hypothetical protein